MARRSWSNTPFAPAWWRDAPPGWLAVRAFGGAAEFDMLNEPAGGDSVELVDLLAFFADAADATVLGVDLVVRPRLAGANLGVVEAVRRGGQHLHLVGCAARQVEPTRDQVLGFGLLETQGIRTERV